MMIDEHNLMESDRMKMILASSGRITILKKSECLRTIDRRLIILSYRSVIAYLAKPDSDFTYPAEPLVTWRNP